MDGGGLQAFADQVLRQPVGAELGAAKHEDLRQLPLADDGNQGVALVVGIDLDDLLVDQIGRRVAPGHLHCHRVAEQRIGQLADLRRKSGREEQRLSLLRHLGDDAPDVVDKPHVEHAVGLVEHQMLHRTKINQLAFEMVEQTARGGHQDLHTLAQRLHLRIHRHTAVDGEDAKRSVAAEVAHALLDLQREFAGGSQDERPHRVPCRRGAGVGVRQHALQDRQREGGGLAGAGLCDSDDVAALHRGRDCLHLDWCRRGVTEFVEGPLDQWVEAERIKAWAVLSVRRHVSRTIAPPPDGWQWRRCLR